jgi:hypothetical protein
VPPSLVGRGRVSFRERYARDTVGTWTVRKRNASQRRAAGAQVGALIALAGGLVGSECNLIVLDAGDVLRVEDQRGREYTVLIRHGDDVETAARKLLRAKDATHGAFYDPSAIPHAAFISLACSTRL